MITVKILSHTENPEKLIAAAAKLCYSQSNAVEIMDNLNQAEVERFTSMLAGLGHLSPMEHSSYTFAIEGVSRALSHQLVRHRLASFSQKSQRYVDMSNVEFIKSPKIEEDDMTSVLFDNCMEDIKESYLKIKTHMIYKMAVEHVSDFMHVYPEVSKEEINEWFKGQYPKEYSKFEKIANEEARAVLPNSCETKLVVTMNVRALFNFFNHRCCERAQSEIRSLAKLMLKEVRVVSPSLFKNAGAPCVSNRICPEGAMQCEMLKGKVPTMKDVKELISKHYHKVEMR